MFIEREPYDTPQVARRDKRGRVWVDGILHVREEPPLKLGILAGDLAHNLRGSLDHLIYQLALLDGNGEAPPGTGFPIAKSEPEYINPSPTGGPSYRERSLGGICDDHRALVDAEQPYVGRSRTDAEAHPLALLNAFSNTDKHRLIHAALVRPAEIEAFPVAGQFDVEVFLPPRRLPVVADGAHIYSLLISNAIEGEVRVQSNFVFSVGFGARGLGDADLLNIGTYVQSLVNRFRPLWD